MNKAKPGSDEAVQKGCICPRIDNHYGKGKNGDGEKYGWFIICSEERDERYPGNTQFDGCPLHGEE